MAHKYENINLIDTDYYGKTTPVVEIESDDVSTSTANNFLKETNNLNINSSNEEKNWNHFKFYKNYFADDYSVICLVKINNFRKFLDDRINIEINDVVFHFQKFNRQLIANIELIPTSENFSVRVKFIEDKNFTNSSNINDYKKKNFKSNPQKSLDKFLVSDNSISNKSNKGVGKTFRDKFNIINFLEYQDEIYSDDFQKILREEEITIDINMGIFTRLKKFFTKNKKEKLKLNIKNEAIIEDFYDYEGLVYEKLVDPFIFRIKFTIAGFIKEKCEDYIGICNEGNTCYMNSIIQSLFHLKHLRKVIYKIPSEEDSPIYSIQKVLFSLQNEKTSIKLLHLFKSLSWEKSFWNSQQDVQEIFSYIFNTLSEQEKNCLDNIAEIANLCEGTVNSKISCLDIELESNKEENFLFLQLDLENSKDLIECIEKFISVESLRGDNRYETEDKIKHDATRTFTFSKIPQILFVHLKRFKCDGIESIKVHQKIKYQDKLNLANYCPSKVDELIYSLYGVIVHDGNLNSGHYFLFIKDFKKNKWIKFNDTKVTYATEVEVFEQNYGGREETFEITENGEILKIESEILRTAYILIYVQKDKIEFLFEDFKKEEIPEYLIDLLTSKKRSNTNLSLNHKKNADPFYPKLSDFCRKNLTNIELYNDININEYNNIGTGPRSKVPTINSNNFYGKNNLNNSTENLIGKVKNEDRDHLNINETSVEKTSKRVKTIHNIKDNKEINKILNKNSNSAKGEESEIIIDINDNYHSNIKNSLHINSHDVRPLKSKEFTKNFVKNQKSLIRKFTFKFIENQTNIFIEEVKIDKSLDKKISAMGLIEESHKNLKSREVDLPNTKLVLLNNMGLFMRIVDENEEITELLTEFYEKKIFLCFYILDLETVLGLNNGKLLSLHLMKKGFDSINTPINIHHKQEFIPKPPVIIIVEKMINNENDFKKIIFNHLKDIFKLSSCNEYNFRLIENTVGLMELERYTQVKVSKTFGTYEFVSISKKELDKDIIIRMAVESSNF